MRLRWFGQDNGVGMTRSELFTNLGTIAKSGSLEFLKRAGEEAAKDIIGQVSCCCCVVLLQSGGVLFFWPLSAARPICEDCRGLFSLYLFPASLYNSWFSFSCFFFPCFGAFLSSCCLVPFFYCTEEEERDGGTRSRVCFG